MRIGSTIRQTLLIRSIIDKRGLPKKNFVLARIECMVHWSCETGEVKTIEYNTGVQITKVWYDEVNESLKIDKVHNKDFYNAQIPNPSLCGL